MLLEKTGLQCESCCKNCLRGLPISKFCLLPGTWFVILAILQKRFTSSKIWTKFTPFSCWPKSLAEISQQRRLRNCCSSNCRSSYSKQSLSHLHENKSQNSRTTIYANYLLAIQWPFLWWRHFCKTQHLRSCTKRCCAWCQAKTWFKIYMSLIRLTLSKSAPMPLCSMWDRCSRKLSIYSVCLACCLAV